MGNINIIETRVRGFIEDIQHPRQKKKLNINDLEYQLHQQIEDYYDMDGYTLFYETIQAMVEEDSLSPIMNKQTNGRSPLLPLYYWVNVKKQEANWDRLEMLKRNDLLDFTYYNQHPEWQTDEEWERIMKMYEFLKTFDEREVVSLEERCLELFGHEKFLSDEQLYPEGSGFLQRIGVDIKRLKTVKYGEPFVYWLKKGCDLASIKRILIVENLSFFHTSIKLLEEESLDYEPEMIIYGEGRKIESSFSFFFRMFPEKPYLFYYAGDLDAEGYTIFNRLKERYGDCSIQPALKIYRKMLECEQLANEERKQVRNEFDKNAFFSWFTEEEQIQLESLWKNQKRIPQEVLTVESWRRWL